jgi:hypothetical protein
MASYERIERGSAERVSSSSIESQEWRGEGERSTHLPSERSRTVVYPRDEEALLRLVDPDDTLLSKILDELGERCPFGSVHVDVVLVLDVLLVDLVSSNTFGVVTIPSDKHDRKRE